MSIFCFRSNPKAYYAIDFESNAYKRSSKGVQSSNVLTYNDYRNVVYQNKEISVENVSIRLFQNQMSTVEQSKIGLKNVFVKAFVAADHVTVTPFKKFIQN